MRRVVSRVGDDSLDIEIKSRGDEFKLRDEELGVMDIGGFCNFVDGEFRQSVVKNMITVTPEKRNGLF